MDRRVPNEKNAIMNWTKASRRALADEPNINYNIMVDKTKKTRHELHEHRPPDADTFLKVELKKGQGMCQD